MRPFLNRSYCLSVLLALVCLGLLSPMSASAHTNPTTSASHTHHAAARPNTTGDCTKLCVGNNEWNGYTTGLSVTFTISNPVLVNNNAYYQRFAQIIASDSNASAILAGIEKSNGGAITTFCPSGGGLVYFAIAVTDITAFKMCVPVPSGDINNKSSVYIHPYVSNGGGILVS